MPPLDGASVQPDKDFVALADSSASETKKVTPAAVVLNTLALPVANGGIPNGTIDPDKISWVGLEPETISGDAVQDGSIDGVKLVDGSVAGGKLTDGDIDAAAKLVDNSIPEAKYGLGSVSTRALADGSVTLDKLADGTLAGNIGEGELNGNVIIDGTIANDKLEPIGTDAIADGAITSSKIGVNEVVGENIATDAIEARHFDDSATDSDGGLTVNANGLAIDNTITGGTQAGIDRKSVV